MKLFCLIPVVDTDIWESDSIESLLRLMGHQRDMEEKQLLSNAVIAVFFLRALQAVDYFSGEVMRRCVSLYVTFL